MPTPLGVRSLLASALLSDVTRTVMTAADILIIAYVIYRFILLVRGTRAISLLNGLFVLLACKLASQWMGLSVVNWLLEKAITMVFIALPIVFLPELRRALEQIGRGRLFATDAGLLRREDVARSMSKVAAACAALAAERTGALVVVERRTGLGDFVERGVLVDGLLTPELIVNVFAPGSPLHDGAVIIRGERLAAASCYLPLSENPGIDQRLGTRHRAAIGVTEQTDAVAVVVSEETGAVSLAHDGRLVRDLDRESLEQRLVSLAERRGRLFRFWE